MGKKEKYFLWGIILIAFSVRIYMVQFGLPWVYWVDEDICTRYGIYIALNGTLNPFTFGYPSLIFYLTVILGTISYIVINVFGGNIDWHTFWLSYFGDATILACTGRFFQAVIGTITVLLTYKIGAIINKKVGFISAILITFSPLAIIESHRFAADGIMTFFCTLAVFFAMKYYNNIETKNWVLAGIFVGLAAGTKYLGAFAIVSIWSAELFIQKSIKKLLKSKVLWSSILISVIAFFITTPYLFLKPKMIILDFGRNILHMFGGHFGFENKPLALVHNVSHLVYALSIIGLLVVVAGLIFLFRKNNKLFWILISFPFIHYIITGLWQVSFARYLYIILPPIAIFSGYGLFEMFKRWKTIGIILIFITFTNLAIHTALIERYLSLPNSLTLTREWIINNIPADETIGTRFGNRLFPGNDDQIRSELDVARANGSVDTLYFKGVLYYTPDKYKRPIFKLPIITKEKSFVDKLKSLGSKIIGYKRKYTLPEIIEPLKVLQQNNVNYYVASAVYYQRYRNARKIYPIQNQFYDNILKSENVLASFGQEYELKFREVPSMIYMLNAKTNGIRQVVCKIPIHNKN